MNFNIDDPLESDDSFFDEPKAFGKKSAVSKSAEKRSVEDLFGVTEKEDNNPYDSLTRNPDTSTKTRHTVTFNETVAKLEGNVSGASKSKDDWLGDSEHSKVIDTHSSRKTDFFDDILSVRPKSSTTTKKLSYLDDILKDSKVKAKSTTVEKDMPTPAQTVSNLEFSTASRDRRRPRKGSATGIEDALGLFGENDNRKEDISKSAEDIKTTTQFEKDIPNWLGGSLPVLNRSDEIQKSTESIIQIKQSTSDPIKEKIVEKLVIPGTLKDIADQFKPQNIAVEVQNTYSALHQQEAFLLISLQLKKYEEALAEIKDQQKVISDKQQDQFKSLIDEYIFKQQIGENNIRLQQDRINNQIQMMVSSSFTSKNELKGEGDNQHTKNVPEEFENLIQTMKQRHTEELVIMEESYRKQMSMMEKSNENLETKLKDEIVNIREILEEKVIAIKEKYDTEVTYFKEKIKNLEEEHNEQISILKEKHSQIVQDLKLDHSTQLDYIKQMKQHESDLLDNSKIYSEKINTSVEMLNINTKTLQGIEEKVIHNYDLLAVSRENSIQAKEKEIILMRNTLKKCRQSAEEERSQLITLIRNLETKLADQSHNAREDRWALQQASATLTTRAAALEREADFNRNSIEREREQLKTLKESLLAEQEKMIMQLTEEKLQISSEKARIQVSGKLINNYDIEKIKLEAETAIQVAKELTEKVNAERSHLFRQKKEVEALGRNFAEREKDLNDKETELECLMQEAQRKLKEDKRVLTEAKMMENMYKERLQELQHHWASVTSKEKKLAEEKVLLSKERLSLYSSTKCKKGCILCRSDTRHYDSFDVPDGYSKMSDAEIHRLKLELAEDERESEVSKEDNISMPNNEHLK